MKIFLLSCDGNGNVECLVADGKILSGLAEKAVEFSYVLKDDSELVRQSLEAIFRFVFFE